MEKIANKEILNKHNSDKDKVSKRAPHKTQLVQIAKNILFSAI